jgi:NAD(P)-dependent dehydrogenase (short-subunit alcohol dehydrogenase family)
LSCYSRSGRSRNAKPESGRAAALAQADAGADIVVNGNTHMGAAEEVAPGNVMTALSDDFYRVMGDGDMEAGKQEAAKAYPLGRLGQVEDIAGAVVYLASDAADFITGQILFVDGGYSVP